MISLGLPGSSHSFHWLRNPILVFTFLTIVISSNDLFPLKFRQFSVTPTASLLATHFKIPYKNLEFNNDSPAPIPRSRTASPNENIGISVTLVDAFCIKHRCHWNFGQTHTQVRRSPSTVSRQSRQTTDHLTTSYFIAPQITHSCERLGVCSSRSRPMLRGQNFKAYQPGMFSSATQVYTRVTNART